MQLNSIQRILFTVMAISLMATIAVPAQTTGPQFAFKWGELGDQPGQFNAAEGIALDADGNIYVADTLNHRIQVFDADGAFLREWGSFCNVADGEGCADAAGLGQFNAPEGVAVNIQDQLIYVSDSSNSRIQVFDINGEFIRSWGEEGTGDGQFILPVGIDVDVDGNVYVADVVNHRIQVFTANGEYLRQWGSRGTTQGQFQFPADVALSSDGESIYVVDNLNDRIQQFDLDGNFIRTWGSACDLATGDLCQVSSGDGQFELPFAVDVGPDGDVYVVDQGNDRVQIFTSEGEFIRQFGSPCALVGSDEIPAGTGCRDAEGDGQFFSPKGIAVTAEGRIYISDSDNYRIQAFD